MLAWSTLSLPWIAEPAVGRASSGVANRPPCRNLVLVIPASLG
jgi:hypothetical protein